MTKNYLNLIQLATPSESAISACWVNVLDDADFTLPYGSRGYRGNSTGKVIVYKYAFMCVSVSAFLNVLVCAYVCAWVHSHLNALASTCNCMIIPMCAHRCVCVLACAYEYVHVRASIRCK